MNGKKKDSLGGKKCISTEDNWLWKFREAYGASNIFKPQSSCVWILNPYELTAMAQHTALSHTSGNPGRSLYSEAVPSHISTEDLLLQSKTKETRN